MGYIICYLVIGVVLTMLLYRPEPEESPKEAIADAGVSILTWPFILVITAIDTLRKDH